ncbi:MAG: hypothetical protein HY560_03870 [Gemmatimonadetes bacterium]|nr:hypothetical protein [Gemmatimonadota bacterium]
MLGHLPTGGFLRGADIEIEQELSRPYVYWNRRFQPSGLDIISVKDPAKPQMIWSWTIADPELHLASGSLAPAYVKTKGRYYVFNGFEFGSGGPDVDLGAVVWDVTALPDTSKIREVARIRVAEAPGGFHETFGYKHSSGQALVFAVTRSPFAYVYDIDQVVAGGRDQGRVARIQVPLGGRGGSGSGWHDFYVGYDPATHQDRFYGAGEQGYHVFDITNLADPKLLTSVVGVPGTERGHTFTVSPDGRYAFGMPAPHYSSSVMRVFDLKPGLDGQVKSVSRALGAWTANWQNVMHNWEVRWPYIFAAAFEDGLQVINVMDPTNPYTVGFYDTWDGPHFARESMNPSTGAWGVDVRNADGLIVVSDIATGFWAFKMDGFEGWNGHQWGMPNQSSAQDWDNGPDGAPKPQRVS